MSNQIEAWEYDAYVDDTLPAERRAAIDAAARRSPEIRERLAAAAALQADLDTLRAAEASVGSVEDELPPAIRRRARQLARRLERDEAPWRFAALSWLSPRNGWIALAGGLVGWTAASIAAIPTGEPETIVDEATEIHRTITMAPSFAQDATQVDFEVLSKLFAHRLLPPDLLSLGFRLTKVDVAATDDGPAIVLLYRDKDDVPASLVVSFDEETVGHRSDRQTGSHALRPAVTTHSDLAVGYGRDGELAFAVTSPLSESAVLEIANKIAREMSQ